MADRRLQVFYTVVKAGSFTKAAERLFMTQPAVTFQIKQLEEHFNTRLLERGHGKLKLTPAGEIVFAYAEKMLSLARETMPLTFMNKSGEAVQRISASAASTLPSGRTIGW